MRIRSNLPIAAITAMLLTCSCSSTDDSRVPFVDVNLEINSAQWSVYGVFSYGENRKFIRSEKVPSGFPYTASTFTGFGGILLISGAENGDYNSPLAYDLACPVEIPKISRIYVDDETFEAVCPTCNSHYNVCEGWGRAISGPAHEKKYDLRRYRIYSGMMGGYTIRH